MTVYSKKDIQTLVKEYYASVDFDIPEIQRREIAFQNWKEAGIRDRHRYFQTNQELKDYLSKIPKNAEYTGRLAFSGLLVGTLYQYAMGGNLRGNGHYNAANKIVFDARLSMSMRAAPTAEVTTGTSYWAANTRGTTDLFDNIVDNWFLRIKNKSYLLKST